MDGKIKDKTARSKIYKKMKPFLPKITDANLRKKTERARKILKLYSYFSFKINLSFLGMIDKLIT